MAGKSSFCRIVAAAVVLFALALSSARAAQLTASFYLGPPLGDPPRQKLWVSADWSTSTQSWILNYVILRSPGSNWYLGLCNGSPGTHSGYGDAQYLTYDDAYYNLGSDGTYNCKIELIQGGTVMYSPDSWVSVGGTADNQQPWTWQ